MGDAEVELQLPDGSVAQISGDAADESIVGTIRSHGGTYEPGLMAALAALVAPAAVCLDVGANVGPVALALGRLCSEGSVHAFEPAAESFGFLEHNLARNGAHNVTAHRVALSDHAGTATINYNRQAAGAAFISEHLVDGVAQEVPLTTLDDWVAEHDLGRLDLVKIDVEGSELRVLDGAGATLRRFRPTLVVELNPVTLRRMQHRDPRDLYRRLGSLYGRVAHLAVVPDDGPLLPLVSWAQLRRHLAESGVCNLVCSPERLVPGRHPAVARPRQAAARLARSRASYRRGSIPEWAAVVDPKVLLRVDGPGSEGTTSVRGTPGSRHDLELVVANHGDVAIVGRTDRMPVSVRVVWIDAEGHHQVDDRSRVPAPTLRPGCVGSVRLPLFLPERPGHATARVTLFQEHIAWFYDLDPANCRELAVEVAPAG